MNLYQLKNKANSLRKELLLKFIKTRQGHPGIFSIIDFLTVLYYKKIIKLSKNLDK